MRVAIAAGTGMQLDLFAPQQADDRTKQKRIMHAIDSINERFSKNQIHFAVQGGESDTEDDPAGFMRAKNVE